MSKAEKVKNINQNKKDERQYEREKKGTERSDSIERPNNVIPLRGQISSRKSFKLPSRLSDLLKEEHSDD